MEDVRVPINAEDPEGWFDLPPGGKAAKSSVWKYFARLKKDSGARAGAKCMIVGCDAPWLSYSNKAGNGSTGNLHKHLKLRHPLAHDHVKERAVQNLNIRGPAPPAAGPPPRIMQPGLPRAPTPRSGRGAGKQQQQQQQQQQQHLSMGGIGNPLALSIIPIAAPGSSISPIMHADPVARSLAFWMCMDLLPLRLAESKPFRSFCSLLRPGVDIPTRSAVEFSVDTLFEEGKARIRSEIAAVRERVRYGPCLAAMADAWTSPATGRVYNTFCLSYVRDGKLVTRALWCGRARDLTAGEPAQPGLNQPTPSLVSLYEKLCHEFVELKEGESIGDVLRVATVDDAVMAKVVAEGGCGVDLELCAAQQVGSCVTSALGLLAADLTSMGGNTTASSAGAADNKQACGGAKGAVAPGMPLGADKQPPRGASANKEGMVGSSTTGDGAHATGMHHADASGQLHNGSLACCPPPPPVSLRDLLSRCRDVVAAFHASPLDRARLRDILLSAGTPSSSSMMRELHKDGDDEGGAGGAREGTHMHEQGGADAGISVHGGAGGGGGSGGQGGPTHRGGGADGEGNGGGGVLEYTSRMPRESDSHLSGFAMLQALAEQRGALLQFWEQYSPAVAQAHAHTAHTHVHHPQPHPPESQSQQQPQQPHHPQPIHAQPHPQPPQDPNAPRDAGVVPVTGPEHQGAPGGSLPSSVALDGGAWSACPPLSASEMNVIRDLEAITRPFGYLLRLLEGGGDRGGERSESTGTSSHTPQHPHGHHPGMGGAGASAGGDMEQPLSEQVTGASITVTVAQALSKVRRLQAFLARPQVNVLSAWGCERQELPCEALTPEVREVQAALQVGLAARFGSGPSADGLSGVWQLACVLDPRVKGAAPESAWELLRMEELRARRAGVGVMGHGVPGGDMSGIGPGGYMGSLVHGTGHGGMAMSSLVAGVSGKLDDPSSGVMGMGGMGAMGMRQHLQPHHHHNMSHHHHQGHHHQHGVAGGMGAAAGQVAGLEEPLVKRVKRDASDPRMLFDDEELEGPGGRLGHEEVDETALYRAMPRAGNRVDALKWWEEHEGSLPVLSVVAGVYLPVMATACIGKHLFGGRGDPDAAAAMQDLMDKEVSHMMASTAAHHVGGIMGAANDAGAMGVGDMGGTAVAAATEDARQSMLARKMLFLRLNASLFPDLCGAPGLAGAAGLAGRGMGMDVHHHGKLGGGVGGTDLERPDLNLNQAAGAQMHPRFDVPGVEHLFGS
eukprot:jgi/Mesvir1/23640/Mv25738-RA.1